jgi:hypothetical protein
VLLHVPSDQADELEHLVDDVTNVARSHGIGVVTAADPGDYESWNERAEARRVEPDPERLASVFRGDGVEDSIAGV